MLTRALALRLAVNGHTRILLTYILPVLLLSVVLNLPRILSMTPLGNPEDWTEMESRRVRLGDREGK